VIAVMGGEGVGKTWLVAQWWLGLPGSPIMLLVAGRQAECLVAGEPLESLARLIARQAGDSEETSVRGWQRRLQRWKGQRAEAHLRFIVVLDGINEQVTRPWADLIKELAREAQALGGLVVVTCREAFWHRDVSPRLQGSVEVRELVVGGYSDEELAAVLAQRKIIPGDLSPKVCEFLRNPRICSVALSLVGGLSLQPNELTVERLLVEYWQSRLQERGDLIAHNVQDFEKMLRSHARAWREQPKRRFDRDEWAFHSGVAHRFALARVQNDLTEIEEGRFLQIAPDDSGAYEFRSEVLPYALGLLINAEIKDELRRDGDPNEQLDKILDTIRGFDLVADIIAAAVGLACLDEGFPSAGRSAPIEAWLGLQNIEDAALDAMAAYVLVRPDAFLDAAEMPAGRLGNPARYDSLSRMLMCKRDHPAVWAALLIRLPRWLGQWSRRAPAVFRSSDGPEKQAEHEARMEATLGSLSEPERAQFRRLTVEVSDEGALQLDWLAASLIAGRPLRPFAEALFGWAFAQAVAGSTHSADEALEWVVRLNPADWSETSAAIQELTAGIDDMSSEAMKRAAAIALSLLGDKHTSDRASRLLPCAKGWRWRLVETFCDTNPHDPDAAPGTNLDNARNAVAASAPSDVWVAMSQTMADHQLELVTPALARFDPLVIVRVLRGVLAAAPNRTGLHLRQLTWRLVELSPIFDQSVLAAVRRAYDSLLAHPDRIREADRNWVASSLVRAMTPHLSSEGQLDLLLSLPGDCPLYLNLRSGLRPLPPDVLEARLAASVACPRDLGRTLFFASGSKPKLTPGSRLIIAKCLTDDDETISASAADIVWMADDPELYDRVLDEPLTRDTPGENPHAVWLRSRAVAAAVVARNREDLIDWLPPRILDLVAQIGGPALDRLAGYIERVIRRLLRPVAAGVPRDLTAFLETSEDGFSVMRRVEDKSEPGLPSAPRDMRSAFNALSAVNDPEEAARRYSERHRLMVGEMEVYERAIIQDGATEMFTSPPRKGLNELVRRDPTRVGSWIAAILATQDTRILSQIRNLGLSLASAYAANDPEKAADLFRHLKDHTPPINVLIGDEKIPFHDYALFTATDAEPIAALRREAVEEVLDDAALQMLLIRP
jgi:hypothetical protein